MSLIGVRLGFKAEIDGSSASSRRVATVQDNVVEFSDIASLDRPGDAFTVPNADVDVAASRITLQIDGAARSFGRADFNGFVFDIASDDAPTLYSATIGPRSGFAGLSPTDVSLNAGRILVNVAGLAFENRDGFAIDVGFVFRGGAGEDTLNGLGGADLLQGRGGNDDLSGGAGHDRIEAGAGDDQIAGGLGVDRLIGGLGADAFVYARAGDSRFGLGDVIVGFDDAGDAAGDLIDLAQIDPNAGLAGDQAFVFGRATGVGAMVLRDVNGQTVIELGLDRDAGFEMRIRIADGATSASDYVAADFIL